MKLEEYGKENNSIIVMLHGANFVHCYGRQYSLAIATSKIAVTLDNCRKEWYNVSQGDEKNGQNAAQ